MKKNSSNQSNGEAYIGFVIGFCLVLYWDLFPEHFTQDPTLYILFGATLFTLLSEEKKEEDEFV